MTIYKLTAAAIVSKKIFKRIGLMRRMDIPIEDQIATIATTFALGGIVRLRRYSSIYFPNHLFRMSQLYSLSELL